MTGDAPRFDVEPLESVPEPERIDLLARCFQKDIDHDWYQWKHNDGPWGPSHGRVARDDHGLAAVLFCLPWRLRVGEEILTASRMVDGGTLPRALGRGLFRTVCGQEVQGHRDAGDDIVFGTATPAAAKAHVANGARTVELAHAYSVAPVSAGRGRARVEITTPSEALREYQPIRSERHLATDWSGSALAWRFDARSGYRYQAAHLRHGDGPSSLIYRVESRRHLRVMVIELYLGVPRDRSVLTAAAARAEHAYVVLDVQAAGRRPSLVRGRSLLCEWDLANKLPTTTADFDPWTGLALAELEGVI